MSEYRRFDTIDYTKGTLTLPRKGVLHPMTFEEFPIRKGFSAKAMESTIKPFAFANDALIPHALAQECNSKTYSQTEGN
jgi:hypothetical protein